MQVGMCYRFSTVGKQLTGQVYTVGLYLELRTGFTPAVSISGMNPAYTRYYCSLPYLTEALGLSEWLGIGVCSYL